MPPYDDRKRWKSDLDATRRHPAREPSDAPPSMPPTPYDLPVREGVGSLGYRTPVSDPSFGSALRHFAAAAERMSKRLTALLAVASMAGILGSTALAYWVTRQGFVTQDTIAQINASVRRIEAAVETQSLTGQNQREQLKLVNEALFQHTQLLAELTPPGTKRRR